MTVYSSLTVSFATSRQLKANSLRKSLLYGLASLSPSFNPYPMPLSLSEIKDRAIRFAQELQGVTDERADAQSF